MTTDQLQTGVPSVSKFRTQLTKPFQANNSGSTQLKSVSDPTSEKYNPILAKYDTSSTSPLSTPSVAPKPATSGIRPTVDETGYNPKYGYATGMYDKNTDEELFFNMKNGVGYQATPSYQDLVAELGKRFGNLTESDQLRFLDNVAKGVYRANGYNGAVMTGEPNAENTKGTRVENLGQPSK